MLRFSDCIGVQSLRTGLLVYSLLIVQIWATCRQRGGADRAVWRGTVCYLLGKYMASSGLLRLTSPRFQNFGFIFNGLIPRSCSTLPLLSFHLATA